MTTQEAKNIIDHTLLDANYCNTAARQEAYKVFFELVEDKADWKNRVHRLCQSDLAFYISEAVEFFTGTQAHFFPVSTTMSLVKADGYYNGPCN